MEYTWHILSPLGGITLAGDGEALTGLWFDGQKHFPSTFTPARESKRLPVFAETERWLDIYFSGKDPGFTPQLCLRGTAFQRTVWDILLSIPFGRTVTYGEIARRITAARMSAQAVGGAVGWNPICIIIPCHRVVGSGGSFVGYGGGIENKVALLEHEKAF